ncbi:MULTISPECIES: TerD family protein [unclassified Frankia]|uniref:TerD family protein n=1 Tax=unclassified Frankia TaxID=2632575 RepID=UPI001EF63FEA|nr:MULTISPECIES: TerD family protein [unclassified Frankia]
MAQVLSKGANASLPITEVRVEIISSTPLDIAALLVTASGKVRSDADFVFFNQPTGPGVRLLPPAALEFALAQVPADIDKVVITGSLDGSGPPAFATVERLQVVVRDPGGAELARFDPVGLTVETALILVELYRRQGAWKVRAVGQGYASGLAGIATDFGITVDEPGAVDEAPTQLYVPPAQPSSPAAPVPHSQSWGGSPQSSAAPAQQSRSWGPPQAWGPPRPGQQQSPPPVTGAPAVNLDKGRVSLHKGQSVSLVKTGAAPLTRVRMALGWDPAHRGRQIDLDASCILFDGRGKDVDKVWFMSKKGARGAVRHSGDNLTGSGEGDDETIFVDLAALPASIEALVFTVNSFQGQHFTEVRNAFCRLVDDFTGAELVRFDLSESKPHTGLVMCKVARQQGGPHWTMTAIGEFHDGKTVRAMVGPSKQYL